MKKNEFESIQIVAPFCAIPCFLEISATSLSSLSILFVLLLQSIEIGDVNANIII